MHRSWNGLRPGAKTESCTRRVRQSPGDVADAGGERRGETIDGEGKTTSVDNHKKNEWALDGSRVGRDPGAPLRVQKWVNGNNDEIRSLSMRSEELCARLDEISRQCDGLAQPNVTQTAASIDILRDLCACLKGRVGSVARVVLDDALQSVYKDYASKYDGPCSALQPYFHIMKRLLTGTAALHVAENDAHERQKRLVRSQQTRLGVLQSAIGYRQSMLLKICFRFWRENIIIVKRQRKVMEQLLSVWKTIDTGSLEATFRRWKNYVNKMKYVRMRNKIARLRKRCEEAQQQEAEDNSTADGYTNEERQARREIRRLRAISAVLTAQLQQLNMLDVYVKNQHPLKITPIAANSLFDGLCFLEKDLKVTLQRGGLSRISFNDPLAVFQAEIKSRQQHALAYMHDLSELHLILLWMNYILRVSGSRREVQNFGADLADCEALLCVLEYIQNKAGLADRLQLDAKRVIKTEPDAESRARLVLEFAEELTDLTSGSAESNGKRSSRKSHDIHVHELLTARDIVNMRNPDLTAVWLAKLMRDHFSVTFDVQSFEQSLLPRIHKLKLEVSRLLASSTQLVSVEWLQGCMEAYRVLFADASTVLSTFTLSQAMWLQLERRVNAFVLHSLTCRLKGMPVSVSDKRELDFHSTAIESIDVNAYGDVLSQEQNEQQNEAVVELQNAVTINFRTLSEVYTYYCQKGLDGSASTIGFGEFTSFLKDIQFDSCRPHEAAKLVAVPDAKVQELFVFVAKGGRRAVSIAESAPSEQQTVKLSSEIMQDLVGERDTTPALAQRIDICGFVEVLCRLANLRYPNEGTPATRFHLFMRFEVLNRAKTPDLATLSRNMRNDQFMDTISEYGFKLRRVFEFYSTRSENSVTLSTCISHAAFTAMLKDTKLLDGDDQGEGSLSSRDVNCILSNAFLCQLKNGSAKSRYGSPGTEFRAANPKDVQLTYPEFLEALTAVAAMKYTDCRIPLSRRFRTFFETDFLPALRNKIQASSNSDTNGVKAPTL